MEILNSGSFIPLDNREKIEQLIFTAQTLASEVSRSKGFQSTGQSNQQIGLDLWKGAEYMTRAHEEVTIRNIFLSKFLERLREIERETPQETSSSIVPAEPSAEDARALDSATSSATPTKIETESTVEARDEFLGVVDSEEPVEERPSYANECIPECEDEIVSMLNSSGTRAVVDASGEQCPESSNAKSKESDKLPKIDRNDAIQNEPVTEVENKIDTQVETPDVSVAADAAVTEQSVNAVILSEQEPYNFDSCTVTAVIQLLPETNGLRDCVVSVRSHDFAPQITFTDGCNESGKLDVSMPVSTALELYRNTLPVLAAEKMKKEQTATRKRASKTLSKSPNKALKADANAETASTSTPIPQEQAKDQQTLFAS